MKRFSLSLVVVLVVATAAAQVAPVGGISPTRTPHDMIILWDSVPDADGYRVYRYDDPYCSSETLVYEGTKPVFDAPGALDEQSPAIWRIAAFTAGDESPLSPPIVRHWVDISGSDNDPASSGMVSAPESWRIARGTDLCTDINDALSAASPVMQAAVFHPDTLTFTSCRCVYDFPHFPILPTEAVLLIPDDPQGPKVRLWGLQDDYVLSFHAREEAPGSDPGCYLNINWVALPYDHAYPDLRSLGDDIPGALDVRLMRLDNPPCLGVGVSRDGPDQPWRGTNRSLHDYRGLGVQVTVAATLDWSPRRYCSGARRAEPIWLLRNDQTASLAPPPDLAAIFTGSGAGSLDMHRPDTEATEGEGPDPSEVGSIDDDDAYIRAFPADGLDPDAGIVADGRRPLVFYQVTEASTILRLVRSGSSVRALY